MPVPHSALNGPWSVSVAEAPYDSRSFSVYIKTPTHNLTLTRTAMEIIQLDIKLRAAQPCANIPPLPTIATSSMPSTKRKSTFLKALAKLSRKLPGSSSGSPASELADPFLAMTPNDTATTSTALAAYLTTVSNVSTLRGTGVWRRFMRVRTDDLQSTRAERPVKRARPHIRSIAHRVAGREGLGSTEARSNDSQESEILEKRDSGVVIEDGTKDNEISPERLTRAYRSHSASAGVSRRHSTSLVTHAHSREDNNRPQLYPDSASASSPTSSAFSESSLTSSPPPTHSELVSQVRLRPPRKSFEIRIDDFEMMRVLGKGCAGKVLLVKKKDSTKLYALKAIMKRHVLAHQELMHTLTEQAVLKRLGRANDGDGHPFVVKMWWSFHDKENLFLVMDFHPGGDLATQLSRWGRLGRDRARFYAAEIVEGVEGLHRAGIVYRDLKPENILIAANGHVVLTDFGLSKQFTHEHEMASGSVTTAPSTPKGTRRWESVCATGEYMWNFDFGGIKREMTQTFCGTAEYLAPEVIRGLPYSYEVDWWALGTLLYEMLVGITPFWAATQIEMYQRVLDDELKFPESKSMDVDTKSFLSGLLHRNPLFRLSEPHIKQHPYFSMIDWSHVYHKRYIPPYIPPTDPCNASDTQNFDAMFLDMEPVLDATPDGLTGDLLSSASSYQTKASHEPVSLQQSSVDLFRGYSFKGAPSDDAHGEVEHSDDMSGSVYSQSGDGESVGLHKDAERVADTTLPVSTESELILPTVQAVDESQLASSLSLPHDLPTIVPSSSSSLRTRTTTDTTSIAPSSVRTGADDEDDWDLVEYGMGTDRNGASNTLFSRGVVDRYRLAFRKDRESSHSRRASKASGFSDTSTNTKFSARPLFRRNSSAKQFLRLRIGSKIGAKEGKAEKQRPLSVDMGRFSMDAQMGRLAMSALPSTPSVVTSPTLSNSSSGTAADTLAEEDENDEHRAVERSSFVYDSSDIERPISQTTHKKKGPGNVFLLLSPSART